MTTTIEPGNLAQWYSSGVSTLSLLIVILLAWLGTRRTEINALKAEQAHQSSRIGKTETRLTSIEGELQHLPDKDAVHDLKISIAMLTTEVRVIAERVSPIKAIAERMQDALVEQATHSQPVTASVPSRRKST